MAKQTPMIIFGFEDAPSVALDPTEIEDLAKPKGSKGS